MFCLKVKALLLDLKDRVLGLYQAHVYTIEYQKRGLPHIHLLLWLLTTTRFLTAKRINKVVYAELLDPLWDLTGKLKRIVTGNITHRPCGLDYPNSVYISRKFLNGPLEY